MPTPMSRTSRVVAPPMFDLRLPRRAAPVDLEEHLRRIPGGATVKGMFFVELQRRAELASVWTEAVRISGVAPRRYHAFQDYPMADNLRIAVAVATLAHPKMPLGDALRLFGETALDVVLDSQIGRAVFGLLGRDVESIFLRGPRAFKLLIGGPGEVTAEKIARRTYRFRALRLPLFLETYQIGMIEGVLRHCGEGGRVLIALEDVANATFQVELA